MSCPDNRLSHKSDTASSKDIVTLLYSYTTATTFKDGTCTEDSDLASEESEQDDSCHSAECGEPSKSPALTTFEPVPRWASTETCPKKIPASKGDKQNLLTEMKACFAADIVLVQEDMGVMTASLQALEVEADITRSKQDDLNKRVG
ncbi:Hypothetical predicted protein [Pelobates cultripes]|uniref:Uncharacterized protein n=1 Tax=Pelobates cultripes TaxID=61616 RepID=A0AAD1SZI4_PELCU|nr:Hypothetical predicted protein [Pelobates cultripes]